MPGQCEHGCYGSPAGFHCGCCARLTNALALSEERRQWIDKHQWRYEDRIDCWWCQECEEFQGHTTDCSVPRLIAKPEEVL